MYMCMYACFHLVRLIVKHIYSTTTERSQQCDIFTSVYVAVCPLWFWTIKFCTILCPLAFSSILLNFFCKRQFCALIQQGLNLWFLLSFITFHHGSSLSSSLHFSLSLFPSSKLLFFTLVSITPPSLFFPHSYPVSLTLSPSLSPPVHSFISRR